MNVVIVTADDQFFIPRYLTRVLENNSPVCAVIALPVFRSFHQMVDKTLEFFGFKLFCLLGFKFFMHKLVDRLGLVCRKNRLPLFRVSNINSASSLELIRSLNADLIFSLAAPQKIKADLLSLPKYGCFNIHSSLLPRYRGINAIFWAMLNNEKKTGFTIHKMDSGFDTGPIVLQQPVPILRQDSYADICHRVIDQASPAINDFFKAVQKTKGEINYLKPRGRPSYFGFPSSQDRKKFLGLKRRFFA